jgi:hypothetical protein
VKKIHGESYICCHVRRVESGEPEDGDDPRTKLWREMKEKLD